MYDEVEALRKSKEDGSRIARDANISGEHGT
jgi:hypothetical protein